MECASPQRMPNATNIALWDTSAVKAFEPVNHRSKQGIYVNWGGAATALVDGGFVPLRDVMFEDGVIEVDLAKGPFLGVGFRGQADGRYELIYFRPTGVRNGWRPIQYGNVGNPQGMPYHLATNFPDTYQGFAELPEEDWFHVKIAVVGERMDVFVDGATTANFTVTRLLQAERRGALGLWAWEGCFANFRYTPPCLSQVWDL
jgi:hypothetical protein